MNTDFLRYLRLFLLSFALAAVSGCGWFDRDDNESSSPKQPEEPEEPEFPDPPVYPGGKFFGTAPDNADDYLQLLTYFNQLTPGNAGKWGSVEGTRDMMNWTALDTAYQFARDHEIPFKLHTLIWGQQQPGWMDSLSQEEQLEEIEEWFSELAARYPDIEMIDVVNEPINAPPSYAAALGGAGVTGWDWAITAFEMARESFPEATLILNEYRVLHGPEFTQQYLELIDLLQDRGLIDAIGEEGHFLEKTSASMIQTNLDTLATTGLPIYITEFDLNIADDAQHANVMRDLFTVFWEHPAVQGVTHWGYRQGSMWRPDGWLLGSDGIERAGLRWLICYLEGDDDCDVHVPVYTPSGWQGNAGGLTLEAELFDEGSGVLALGGVVAHTNAGEWIKFSAVEFQNGWNKLSVYYSKGDDDDVPAANITIHLGSLANPEVAVVDLPSTGGWGVFDMIEVDWTALSTTEDIYIRFNDDPDAVANLDYVRFFMSEEDPEPEPEDGNLVANGGFESGTTTGWQSWNGSTLATSSAQKYSGSQSMLVTSRPNTNQFAVYELAVQPNTTYAVSARVYHNGAAATTIRLAAKIDCTAATMPGGFNEFPWLQNNTAVAPATWTELSANLVIPDCTLESNGVAIFFEGTPIDVTEVYIDAVTVLPPPDPGDGNIVANSGFESGTTGWSSWNGSTLATSSAQAHDGSQSLLVTGRPNTNQFAVYDLADAVPGTIYAVSAWVYQASGAETTIRLAAKIDCTVATMPGGFNEFPWLQNNTAVASGTWTQLSGNLTIPDCTLESNGVAIFFEGTPTGVVEVYIDEVSVIPREDLVTDGGFELGTTGWQSWNGSTLATSSAQKYSGSQSMLATSRPNTNQFAVYELAVQPNTTYAVSARVYHNGAAATTIRLAAKIDCTVATMPGGFNEFPWLQNNTAVAPATWTELSANLVIPDCTLESNGVAIFFEGTPIDITEVFIDAVSVLAP